MSSAGFVYTPRFAEYDLGQSHPMRPVRVLMTYELIRACGLLESPRLSLLQPSAAEEDSLALIHSREYLKAVRSVSEGRGLRNPLNYGLGTPDNPIVPGMYEAAAIIVGGSLLAADMVMEGKASVAFNPAGGLHHAHHSKASGFCLFNDCAITIAHIMQKCGEGVKVAYIDIDAHHGDGVQEAFYDRRDVLTISVHENGRYLFPHTGWVNEIGEGEGEGFSVNLPLSPYTTDEVYLWAFREAVIPILEAFQPDFICTQLGIDTHFKDPLTHMSLTTRGFMSVVEEIAQRAPRWIALGGGGYEVQVVPRAWTLAFARMAGLEPPEQIPESQTEMFRELSPETPNDEPILLHDAVEPEVEAEWRQVAGEYAEKSVREVKDRIFGYHGI